MWICNNCREQSDDHFELCWNCQFDRSGEPHSRPEDDVTEAREILEPVLGQNESLKHWAYGIEPMPIEKKLLFFTIAVLVSIMIPITIQLLFINGLPIINQTERLSPITTIIIAFGMSYLLYKIMMQLTIKNCVMGLTDQRLYILICKNKFQVEKVLKYRLNNLPIVVVESGDEQSQIEVRDWRHPVSAKFFRTDRPDNFDQAVAITNMLSGVKSRQGSCQQAVSYCPMCKAEYSAGYTECNNCHSKLVGYAD